MTWTTPDWTFSRNCGSCSRRRGPGNQATISCLSFWWQVNPTRQMRRENLARQTPAKLAAFMRTRCCYLHCAGMGVSWIRRVCRRFGCRGHSWFPCLWFNGSNHQILGAPNKSGSHVTTPVVSLDAVLLQQRVTRLPAEKDDPATPDHSVASTSTFAAPSITRSRSRLAFNSGLLRAGKQVANPALHP